MHIPQVKLGVKANEIVEKSKQFINDLYRLERFFQMMQSNHVE
jgi:hypothetical protein